VIEELPAQDDEGLFFWSSAIAVNPALPLLATSERTVRLWSFDADLLTISSGDKIELSSELTRPSEDTLTELQLSAPGIGSSKRPISSITPPRIEFYSPRISSRLAHAPLTTKSAESYVVAFRGGVQVKDRQHESAVAILAKHLQTYNAMVGTPHPLDLFMSVPASVIFEAKKVGNYHPGYAVREAVGQLLEYRYFIGPRDARLCIVIDAAPRDSALTEYVEKELGMLFLWIAGGAVSGGPITAEFFCNRGIKIALEREI